jgi:hypothetical protein
MSQASDKFHTIVTNLRAINLNADALLPAGGVRLVWRLLKVRSKTEEVSGSGLIDCDFLVILIQRSYANGTRNQYVGPPVGGPRFVDALTRREGLHLDLRYENRESRPYSFKSENSGSRSSISKSHTSSSS